jgi:uncharacterized protein (DUF2267 family)
LEFLRRIQEIGHLPDEVGAIAALTPTLVVLGAVLSSEQREALAKELPAEFTQLLGQSPPWTQAARPDFFRTLAHQELAAGRAVEQTALVCRVLGETLTAAARVRLGRALPALRPLLEPAAYGASRAPSARGPSDERATRSPASTRPGWRRLLSST